MRKYSNADLYMLKRTCYIGYNKVLSAILDFSNINLFQGMKKGLNLYSNCKLMRQTCN